MMVSSVNPFHQFEKGANTRTRCWLNCWFLFWNLEGKKASMTMKSGKQQITGFMKCIIFHSNINQQLNRVDLGWAEPMSRMHVDCVFSGFEKRNCFLFKAEKKCTSVPQVKWNPAMSETANNNSLYRLYTPAGEWRGKKDQHRKRHNEHTH